MEGIIGLAGVMPRIGTSTQTLELARYMKERCGYKAAYVECNAQDYIWSASEMYQSAKHDQTGGHITIEGIEMYVSSRLAELTSGGADIDFLVCDYGDMTGSGFDKTGFLNTTVQIAVAGVKPNEIHYTEMALRKPEYTDVTYIFTHTLPSDREEISSLMGKHSINTFFAPYIPDPFQEINEETGEYLARLMEHIIGKIRDAGKCIVEEPSEI